MPVQFRDYYQTLGVAKTASQDEIKSAFRKLARTHHPDVAKDKKSAEEKFKEINEAYEVLSDPEKRRKYDDYGANWQQAGGSPPPGGGSGGGFGGFPGGFSTGGRGASRSAGADFHFGGTGFSDFFEQMFGSRRGGFGGGYSDYEDEGPERGQDIEADFLVTLEEALHGSTRQISFRKGENAKPQTFTVKIPKGIREGQRIRLAGQGYSGSSGGTAGDLYLRIKFEKHPEFDREGDDLYYDLELPVHEAVLGCEREIPTPDGRAKLHIPAGTQSGQKFRLSNRGLAVKGGGRGNFYAVVRPILPTHPSEAELDLWRKLAALK